MKTADFDENHGFWWKLQFLMKFYGFWWKPQILTKTTDFRWKLQIFTKTANLMKPWLLMKSMDFDKNCRFWWKSMSFDKNCRFWWKLQILMKTADYDENHSFWWNLQTLTKTAEFDENCTFWWKLQILIKTVDLLDTLKMLWSSVVKLAKKFNSTSNKRSSSGEMKIDLKRVGIYTEHNFDTCRSQDELWILIFTPPLEVNWSVISVSVGVRWLLQLSLKCDDTFSHLGD